MRVVFFFFKIDLIKVCPVVLICDVPAENSLLRFASEDKTPGEDFLLGRSLSQTRRKIERGGSPTHYTLVPALQMEVSTSSSDSASLYHVSPLCLRLNLGFTLVQKLEHLVNCVL